MDWDGVTKEEGVTSKHNQVKFGISTIGSWEKLTTRFCPFTRKQPLNVYSEIYIL